MVKNPPVMQEAACNTGDSGSIPGSGRSSGEGNDNPLQYACLGSPMDRGAWWATSLGSQELDMTEQLNYHQTAPQKILANEKVRYFQGCHNKIERVDRLHEEKIPENHNRRNFFRRAAT